MLGTTYKKYLVSDTYIFYNAVQFKCLIVQSSDSQAKFWSIPAFVILDSLHLH